MTKPIVAMVTAVEDCAIAVIEKPAASPRSRVAVERARMPRSDDPAPWRSPFVIALMPRRKSPIPPSSPINADTVNATSPWSAFPKVIIAFTGDLRKLPRIPNRLRRA